MGNVVIDMSMSLDGYIAAPNDTPEQGLGEDGMRLHNWMFDDPTVFERVYGDLTEEHRRRDHGRPAERTTTRSKHGVARVRWARSRASWSRTDPIEGADPLFTFVTDGIESAFAKAQEAAGDKRIGLIGAEPRPAVPGRGAPRRDQDPPARCPARWRPSVVRPAPQADRAGTDGGQPDGRCDASRIPRAGVALPSIDARRTLRISPSPAVA